MTFLTDLQDRIEEINTANGWTMSVDLAERLDRARGHYDPLDIRRIELEQRVVDRQITELALITTEVAEAIEEIRNGTPVALTRYSKSNVEPYDERESLNPDGTPRKPEGVPSELADIIIRTLDFASNWGIDIDAAIAEKLEHNATRAHRHGGKTA